MNRTDTKAVIGITMDIETQPSYAQEPWYALRQNYADIITKSGGIPICLPHENILVHDYLNQIDGLLVTGGMFDIPPHYYGEEERNKKMCFKETRTAFEFALIQEALVMDMPIVGICGGMQLLAVALGGKLIQDIRQERPTAKNHMQMTNYHQTQHGIQIDPKSMLAEIFQTQKLSVNSVHHQALCNLPEIIHVAAKSDDDIIEAIEIKGKRFAYGFQWHPEYTINVGEAAFFKAFIKSAVQSRYVSEQAVAD